MLLNMHNYYSEIWGNTLEYSTTLHNYDTWDRVGGCHIFIHILFTSNVLQQLFKDQCKLVNNDVWSIFLVNIDSHPLPYHHTTPMHHLTPPHQHNTPPIPTKVVHEIRNIFSGRFPVEGVPTPLGVLMSNACENKRIKSH